MQTDNQVKPDDRTECDSTGSSQARCYASRPMTPERHRAYVQRYITEATPYHKEMARLELMMPVTMVQQPDGSLLPTKDQWPQWAKDSWQALRDICDSIKERAAREA